MIEEEVYDEFGFQIDIEEQSYIREEFEKVFKVFVEHNYPEEGDTLMCSIHQSFHDEGHNCVACNLEESADLIASYLKNYKVFESSFSVFTSYIWFLYLMAIRIEEYINIMSLPEGVQQKKFGIFQKIKRWANFIKHPKAFMFVHHPCYSFEGLPIPSSCDENQHEIIIDDKFVKEFYSNGNKNGKLITKLTNKEGVRVEFPNPVNLMEEFVIAQKNFVDLICENKLIQEILEEKATRYYELEDNNNIEDLNNDN